MGLRKHRAIAAWPMFGQCGPGGPKTSRLTLDVSVLSLELSSLCSCSGSSKIWIIESALLMV